MYGRVFACMMCKRQEGGMFTCCLGVFTAIPPHMRVQQDSRDVHDMCMSYVKVFVHIHIPMHMHVHVHLHAHIHVHTYGYVYVNMVCVRVFVCVCVCTGTYVHRWTRMHIYLTCPTTYLLACFPPYVPTAYLLAYCLLACLHTYLQT